MVSIWLIILWIIFAEYVPLVWNNRIGDPETLPCRVNESKNEITCNRSSQLPNLENTNHFIVRSLTLYNWTEEIFDPDALLPLRKLENFTLCQSRVKQIIRPFSRMLPLQILNITNNEIESIESSIFTELIHLKIVDLRNNKLHQFDPTSLAKLPNLRFIYLVGNHWHCSQNFSWILNPNHQIFQYVKDLDLMLCRGPKYNGKPLRQVMNMQKILDTECTNMRNNCTCKLDHVVRVGGSLRPMIIVNCSKQNLTELPRELPSFTSTLILRENKITNLNEFVDNEKYFHLLNVYLDYNEISSIEVLDKSPWLMNVRALNLRGNNLSEVPLRILEFVFNNNRNIANLFLSENPWKCDCSFMTSFKPFLMKYQTVIKDVSDMKCFYIEHGQQYQAPILGLSRNKVCHENTSVNVSFLSVLNYCMVAILIFLFCDFVYNYYKYKKYRKLPWIMSRLPS